MKREKLMAYIAGIIDGDGSISLCKKQDIGAKSPSYFPMIQFSKAGESMPLLLQKEFGGSILRRDLPSGLPFCRWKLEKAPLCRPFLEAISPFLQHKKEQADKILTFIEENPFVRGKRLTYEELMVREKDYIEIKTINSFRERLANFKPFKSEVKKEFIWPYLAGLLDTDGSFSIKKEERNGSFRYSATILISLLKSNGLSFIKKYCPYGSLFVIKSKVVKQGFYYRFGLYKRSEISEVLKEVLPYLVHKNKAANILLHFCENYVSYDKSEEQIGFREKSYQELCEFNKYGVYKSSLIDLEPLPDSAGGDKAQATKVGSVNEASGKTSQEDAVL